MSNVEFDVSDFNLEDYNVVSSTEFTTLMELLNRLKGSTLTVTRPIFVKSDTDDTYLPETTKVSATIDADLMKILIDMDTHLLLLKSVVEKLDMIEKGVIC